MRQDEILDDLNRRMSGDDFSRYLEIRERFSDHAEAMRDLEAELEALVVKYGLLADGQGDPLIPPIRSGSTRGGPRQRRVGNVRAAIEERHRSCGVIGVGGCSEI